MVLNRELIAKVDYTLHFLRYLVTHCPINYNRFLATFPPDKPDSMKMYLRLAMISD
jgi:hypothetical protein